MKEYAKILGIILAPVLVSLLAWFVIWHTNGRYERLELGDVIIYSHTYSDEYKIGHIEKVFKDSGRIHYGASSDRAGRGYAPVYPYEIFKYLGRNSHARDKEFKLLSE